jgi:hypothetical protein
MITRDLESDSTHQPSINMKTTLFATLAALVGTCMIASAQDGPNRPKRPQGPPPGEVLKEFDKDGDGKLSDDERTALRESMKAKAEERRKEMMKKYDTDGDGKLSNEEREKAVAERKAEMLKKYDKDGDGKLSQEERAEMPRPPRGEGGPGGPGGKRPGGKGKGPGGDKPAGEKPPGDKPVVE